MQRYKKHEDRGFFNFPGQLRWHRPGRRPTRTRFMQQCNYALSWPAEKDDWCSREQRTPSRVAARYEFQIPSRFLPGISFASFRIQLDRAPVEEKTWPSFLLSSFELHHRNVSSNRWIQPVYHSSLQRRQCRRIWTLMERDGTLLDH